MNKKIFLLFLILNSFLFSQKSIEKRIIKSLPKNNSSWYFVENKGQWDSEVLFKSSFKGGNLWVQKSKLFFHLKDFADLRGNHGGKFCDTCQNRQHAVHLNFIGCNEVNDVTKINQSSEYFNFFLGNDRSKWASDVHGYQQIVLHELYNGIDLKLIQNDEETKYEYIVKPKSSPNQLLLEVSGAKSVYISQRGELIIKTPLGNIQENKPYAYQIIDNVQIPIECEFQVEENKITYKLGKYNNNFELIIDPVLVFATYSGSVTDNFGMTATYGYDGTVYSGGTIFGNSYPTPDKGVYNAKSNFTLVNGDFIASDVFISKYNENGTKMLWTNFIGGGSDYQGAETVHSLICDKDNNLYAYGATSSSNFPISQNAFQKNNNGGTKINVRNNGALFGDFGTDIYTFKISSDGKLLLGSTYIGGKGNDGINYNYNGLNAEYQTFGLTYNNKNYLAIPYDSLTSNYGDQFRGEIILDKLNNVIITTSSHSTDFPIKNAIQSLNNGKQDGVIVKVKNDFTDLLFSTYIGGKEDDALYSIKVDTKDNLYFCGGSCSNDIITTSNVIHSNYIGGVADGIVGRIKSDFSNYSLSYIGTDEFDQALMLDLNSSNDVYIVGNSFGGKFPILNSGFSNPGSSQFICVLDSSLSTILKSTTYGSGKNYINDVSPCAFLVDDCENVYVSGWGGNILQNSDPTNGYQQDYLNVKTYNQASSNTQTLNFNQINLTINFDKTYFKIRKFSELENMPITNNGIVQIPPNGFDFHLFALDKNFNFLIYATYMGGSESDDHVDGGTSRFDKNGIIYQSICGGCGGHTDFVPKMDPNVHSDTNLSFNCNNIVLKFDFEILAVPKINYSIDTFCTNNQITLVNNSSGYDHFYWEDLTTKEIDSLHDTIVRNYSIPGNYQINLSVENNVCNRLEKSNATLTILENDLQTAYSNVPFSFCTPTEDTLIIYSFKKGNNFYWSDKPTFSSLLNTNHSDSIFLYSFNKNQKLYYRIESKYCYKTDSVDVFVGNASISLAGKQKYCINQLDTILAFVKNSNEKYVFNWNTTLPYEVSKTNDSLYFNAQKNDEVTIIATGDQGCVLKDTFQVEVENSSLTELKIQATPKKILKGETSVLEEFSKINANYFWYNSKDSLISTLNPIIVKPLKTTFYTLRIKDGSCNLSDTVQIHVIEDWQCDFPYVFVPNAFSPNNDGNNDVLYVRGRPAYQIEFRVYNRWGENVFYTNDLTKGWDGSYKGQLLPPDVYDYYLIVKCIDNQTKQIQGNITLLK